MSQATGAKATNTEQAMTMKAEPQHEHRWLQKLVGDWTYETEAPPAPGQPPTKVSGTERVRPIGGIWVQCEGRGEIPGAGPATTQMTLGFDPTRKRFVGTFIGSMMTHLWIYDGGELDAGEKALTLMADGPAMSGDGSMARYRDVIELTSDNERVLTASVLGTDGEWQQFMSMTYRRTSSSPRT